MPTRQIKLNAFMRPASIHTGAWRYPGAWPDMNFNFAHIKEAIQKLEAAKFDAFFMADHMAVLNMPMDALKRSHTSTSWEPFTLLSALSQATTHIGLVATGSTTFDVPYHIARRFASLDHISGGRAGWNIVTTSNPDAALNFGLEEHMEHGERYRRAREFYDVVTGLWDSWADDAFIRDVESGIFFDPDKLHTLNHKGEFLSVKGPLNIARPPQGWPVIVQAGASESGKQLAAETAEAVFTALNNIEAGRAFYADVKGRMQKLGRNPDHMKIQPACFVVVGDTVEEAQGQARQARQPGELRQRDRLAVDRARHRCLQVRSRQARCRRIPESNASKSGRERAIAMAKRENLTVRQLAQRLGGYSGPCDGRHAQDHRRRDGGVDRDQAPATASPSCSRICRAGSTTSSAASFRNCSGAACSAKNTRARRCARTSACRGRATASSTTRRWPPNERDRELPRPRLLRRGRAREGAEALRSGGTRSSASRSGACTTTRSARIRAEAASSPSSNEQLPDVLPWLVLNRGKLTVFTHAQTGNALKDHTAARDLARPVGDAEARSVSVGV